MTTKTKEKDDKKTKSKTKGASPKKRLNGVVYDRIAGVACPSCKMPGGSVTNTLPWEDGLRIRYHVCRRCGKKFKSVESE